MECLNCDTELVNLPKKRPKVFCSGTCRTHYWQKVKRLEKQGLSVDGIVKTMKKLKFQKPVTKSTIELPVGNKIEYKAATQSSYDNAKKADASFNDEPSQFPKPDPLTFDKILGMAKSGVGKDVVELAIKGNRLLTPSQADLIRRKIH